MAKRGQIVVKFIIILMVSAAIIFIYPYIGEKFGKGDVYKKALIAKEIALTIDVLYSYPYDAVIYYDKDLTAFNLEIAEGKVIIYDRIFQSKNLDPTRAEYMFFATGTSNPNIKLESPKKLRIEKTKNILAIRKE